MIEAQISIKILNIKFQLKKKKHISKNVQFQLNLKHAIVHAKIVIKILIVQMESNIIVLIAEITIINLQKIIIIVSPLKIKKIIGV